MSQDEGPNLPVDQDSEMADSKNGGNGNSVSSSTFQNQPQPYVMINMTEVKASQDHLSSPSVQSHGSSATVVNLPSVPIVQPDSSGAYALPSVSDAATTVTTQKFLKYALRNHDDEKAYYELVSIRTEITTHVRYVTVTEQPPPQRDESMLHAFDAKIQSAGAVSEYFSCDGQLIPYTICLPVNPDT
jgi:hypothetical protein